MHLVPTHRLPAGARLAQDVRLGRPDVTPWLRAGAVIEPSYRDELLREGVRAVWIDDEAGRGIDPEGPISEETRQPGENPALRALREGRIVGLANHTILIARDGTERAIDDSSAPIRGGDGAVQGAVLIFRDVEEKRRAERSLEASEARKAAILDTALDTK